ncbi:hypothetical protein SCP_0309400 [Sparassis crispa]|uniref:Uncharacterized protein n=1 Tax=Sparassis crispa TaxID=139825 RepID=A0A401GGI2_9APHY|nr:hypothetical protein SCP_0309400 [Sparassis crispa]GBE81213.1 hypothetical protein SCP_0309400 [Sparassis crispa]
MRTRSWSISSLLSRPKPPPPEEQGHRLTRQLSWQGDKRSSQSRSSRSSSSQHKQELDRDFAQGPISQYVGNPKLAPFQHTSDKTPRRPAVEEKRIPTQGHISQYVGNAKLAPVQHSSNETTRRPSTEKRRTSAQVPISQYASSSKLAPLLRAEHTAWRPAAEDIRRSSAQETMSQYSQYSVNSGFATGRPPRDDDAERRTPAGRIRSNTVDSGRANTADYSASTSKLTGAARPTIVHPHRPNNSRFDSRAGPQVHSSPEWVNVIWMGRKASAQQDGRPSEIESATARGRGESGKLLPPEKDRPPRIPEKDKLVPSAKSGPPLPEKDKPPHKASVPGTGAVHSGDTNARQHLRSSSETRGTGTHHSASGHVHARTGSNDVSRAANVASRSYGDVRVAARSVTRDVHASSRSHEHLRTSPEVVTGTSSRQYSHTGRPPAGYGTVPVPHTSSKPHGYGHVRYGSETTATNVAGSSRQQGHGRSSSDDIVEQRRKASIEQAREAHRSRQRWCPPASSVVYQARYTRDGHHKSVPAGSTQQASEADRPRHSHDPSASTAAHYDRSHLFGLPSSNDVLSVGVRRSSAKQVAREQTYAAGDQVVPMARPHAIYTPFKPASSSNPDSGKASTSSVDAAIPTATVRRQPRAAPRQVAATDSLDGPLAEVMEMYDPRRRSSGQIHAAGPSRQGDSSIGANVADVSGTSSSRQNSGSDYSEEVVIAPSVYLPSTQITHPQVIPLNVAKSQRNRNPMSREGAMTGFGPQLVGGGGAKTVVVDDAETVESFEGEVVDIEEPVEVDMLKESERMNRHEQVRQLARDHRTNAKHHRDRRSYK